MIELRPYQADCLRAVVKHVRAGSSRALLQRVLFLVDRIQLAVQAHETFESVTSGSSYVLRPGMPRRNRQVTIALLQTMISRLGEFDAREFDVVLVDECHRSVFGRWRPCVERFDAIRIGLTATPSCYSKELFGPATYRYTLRRGIEEGYLSPYRIYRATTLITKGGVRVNGTNYGPRVRGSAAAPARVGAAVPAQARRGAGRARRREAGRRGASDGGTDVGEDARRGEPGAGHAGGVRAHAERVRPVGDVLAPKSSGSCP
jgi:hypothetical protein